MPVLDDEMLSALLRDAGESFAVPPSGPADILRRAAGSSAPTSADSTPVQAAFDLGDVAAPRHRRVAAAVRSHRILAVAASLVLVGAITLAGLAISNGGSAPRSAVTASPPTTVVPGGSAAHAFAGSGAVAPPQAGSAAGTSAGGASPENAGASAVPSTSSAPPLPSDAVGQAARIQQSGSLELTVPKGGLAGTIAKLTALVDFYGGFVANSQSQSGATPAVGAPSGSIVLQVPVANFAAVLKSAQSMGKVSGLSTKATDVTAHYVDLQSRIAALEASRQQYLTIMARATSIGDVLAVQAQLDTLQSQIEQLQGQLQVLSSETTYSTLTVNVQEKSTHHHVTTHKSSSLARAWHDSVHGFTDGIDGLIGIAGPALFVLLCAGVLLLAGRLLWRRLQRHIL